MPAQNRPDEGTPRPEGSATPEDRSIRRYAGSVWIYGLSVLVILAGFFVAYQFVEPAPPSRITIATASRSGAYYAFSQKYRKILARNGIELVIRNTAGSIENLKLLRDEKSGVDIALMQSGTGAGRDTSGLVSLGSLYYEPIWVFVRGDSAPRRMAELRGKRIAVGVPGSGNRAVAMQLLSDNGMGEPPDRILPLGGKEAGSKLAAGKLDAVFLVGSLGTPLIQNLLKTDGVHVMHFERASAYTQVHSYLSRLLLPEGVIDLEKNIPPRDTTLLASTANLVARKDFHPALIDLLLQVTAEVHAGGGLFEKRGEFPSPSHLDFPLSKEARRYFEFGPPLLQRYFPFWAATLVDRLKVMLLPLLTLLIPLFKIVPPAYNWQIRSKIYRPYKELNELGARIEDGLPAASLAECKAELERIERKVGEIHVPLSYSEELYNLRLHIELLATKVRSAQDKQAG